VEEKREPGKERKNESGRNREREREQDIESERKRKTETKRENVLAERKRKGRERDILGIRQRVIMRYIEKYVVKIKGICICVCLWCVGACVFECVCRFAILSQRGTLSFNGSLIGNVLHSYQMG